MAVVVGGVLEIHQTNLAIRVEHEVACQRVVHARCQIDPGSLQRSFCALVLQAQPVVILRLDALEFGHLALVLGDHVEHGLGLLQQRLIVERLEPVQGTVAYVALQEVMVGRRPPALHELEHLDTEGFEESENRCAITGLRSLHTGLVGSVTVDEHLCTDAWHLEEVRRVGALDLDPPVGVGDTATDRLVVNAAPLPAVDAAHGGFQLSFLGTDRLP